MNNVGKIDRLIRLILAITIAILHFANVIPAQYSDTALVIAVILAITSLRKCCPIYALLGFGTCGVDSGSQEPRIKVKKMDL